MSRAYFQYLCDIIDGSNYYNLLWLLHNREFLVLVDGDYNRTKDALILRDGYVKAGMDKDATILEVLVSLSIRTEHDIMHDDHAGDRTPEWFWMMMSNLGLSGPEWTDDRWDDIKIDKVVDTLIIFNERRYNRDGTNGGLFPLRSSRRDLRKVELWYQLNWYLLENYEYEFM